MWVGDYCMTSQSIHNGQGHSTGQSVANRSPAGTRWPDQDGVLSRRVSGLQWGKVTERCGLISSILSPFTSPSMWCLTIDSAGLIEGPGIDVKPCIDDSVLVMLTRGGVLDCCPALKELHSFRCILST